MSRLHWCYGALALLGVLLACGGRSQQELPGAAGTAGAGGDGQGAVASGSSGTTSGGAGTSGNSGSGGESGSAGSGTTSGGAGTGGNSGSGGESGSAGSGGDSGTGGTSGDSGTGGNSAAGSGGNSAAGGSSGNSTAGDGGDGGNDALPPCLQPPDAGPCDGAIERFAFDPETLRCVTFVYGGCQGNENRFETLSACEAACVTTLPEGCEGQSFRAFDCPCTADLQCDGACSSVLYEQGGSCAPSSVGYCTAIGEGDCFCRLSGNERCGV